MCRADGGETPTVWTTKAVKAARKPHICDECRRTIEAGEPYRYAFMIWEGDPTETHTCEQCNVGCRWLVENCGGWVVGEVAEELAEHAEEYPDIAPPLLVLVSGMKARWRDADGFQMAVPEMPPSFQLEHA